MLVLFGSSWQLAAPVALADKRSLVVAWLWLGGILGLVRVLLGVCVVPTLAEGNSRALYRSPFPPRLPST